MQQLQPLALRPMEIKSIFDFAIRIYRTNVAPMFLAMAIVQLPFSLLTMPMILKLIDFSNEVTMLQNTGRMPDQTFMYEWLDEGIVVIVIMFVAFFYQVLVTPLGNLACARIARESIHGRATTLGEAFAFAKQRYWPTQVAIAIFVLPLLGISIFVLLPVLAFQTAGNETGIIAASVFGMILIIVAMPATVLFFPRFFPALNGVVQTEEEPEGTGILAQGMWYLKRSWGLTQGYYLRLAGLLILLSFAVNFITRGISETVNLVVTVIDAAVSGGSFGMDFFESMQTQDASTVGLVLTVTTVFTLVILPVWQSLKVLLYYDLRCRKEAYDLKLLLEDTERSRQGA